MTSETDSETVRAYEIDRETVKGLLADSDDDGSDRTDETDTLAEHCRFDYQQSDALIGPDDEPDELTDDDGEVARDVDELVPPKRDPCNPAIHSQRRRAVRRFGSDTDG